MFESVTIIGADGKVLLFSVEDFQRLIAERNHCFICGAPPGSKPFNNEHIIPDWILKRFNLYDEQMRLPNETYIPYKQYTVPCCAECNSELGKKIEKPVSELLKGSYQDLMAEIEKDFTVIYQLFKWQALMHVKTHLKDKLLRYHQDRRKGDEMIGDLHPWSQLHHIHCIARSHYTEAIISEKVYGTMYFLPVYTEPERHKASMFDYIDSLAGKVILIQLDEIAIITVLDDACAAFNVFGNELKKITGPLTSFQLREIVAHLFYINTHLKYRPRFYSTLSDVGYKIDVEVPEILEVTEQQVDLPTLGDMMRFYIEPLIPNDVENRGKIVEELKAGKRRYLFNNDGVFVDPRDFPGGENQ